MARIIRVTEDMARQRLADVPEDKRFWSNDGRVLKNLRELEASLKEMSDETYAYHASNSKSDFSNWIKDVIGDEKLARDLAKCDNRTKAAKAVGERIAWLQAKL